MTRGKNRKAISLTDLRGSENSSTEENECLLWDLEQSTQSQSTATINISHNISISNEPALAHSVPSWLSSPRAAYNSKSVVSTPRSWLNSRLHWAPRHMSKFSLGRVYKKPYLPQNSKRIVHEFKFSTEMARSPATHSSRMISRARFYISNHVHQNSLDEYVVSVSTPAFAQASVVISPATRPRILKSTSRLRSMRAKAISNFGTVFEETEERSASEPPTSSSDSDFNSLDLSCLSFDGLKTNFDAAIDSFSELRLDINGNDLREIESQQRFLQDELCNKFSAMPLTDGIEGSNTIMNLQNGNGK